MKKYGVYFLLLLSMTAHAMNYNDGLQAYNKGNYGAAHDIWIAMLEQTLQVSEAFQLQRLSQQEQRNAQYGLALLYWQGQGVEQSYKQAKQWLNLAAENGHAEASLKLAVLLLNDLAGKKDEQKAWYWMEKAAEAGLADAQYNLGLMLLSPDSALQDISQAKKWLQLASENGVLDATKLLKGINSKAVIQKKQNMSKRTEEYGVQLAAFSAKESMQRFIRSMPAYHKRLFYFSKDVGKKSWFVVMYCCFDSKEEGAMAQKKLPKDLQKYKPYTIKAPVERYSVGLLDSQ